MHTILKPEKNLKKHCLSGTYFNICIFAPSLWVSSSQPLWVSFSLLSLSFLLGLCWVSAHPHGDVHGRNDNKCHDCILSIGLGGLVWRRPPRRANRVLRCVLVFQSSNTQLEISIHFCKEMWSVVGPRVGRADIMLLSRKTRGPVCGLRKVGPLAN